MIKLLKYKAGRVQLILISLVWLLILTLPVLFDDSAIGIKWTHIFKIWKEYSVVFVIFLLNHFVLLPFLFFKGKRMHYFLAITGLILLLTAVLFFTDDLRKGRNNAPFRPPPISERQHMPFPPPPMEGAGEPVPPYANIFIMSLLLIGFDTGLVFSMKWMQSEQIRLKIEKESMENKMAFLQSQISPHFFMNTLNNIHALIDISSEEAKEAIIKLSEIMGYMLYESQTEKISLLKEMNFIKSYVELMKLRFTKDVDIILDIPETLPSVGIPPLLTISFLENAFKHGISYQSPSFVHIKYEVEESKLNFKISNSDHAKKTENKNSGIGIKNSRHRLDLIYGDSYQLAINQRDNTFTVKLNIPL